MIIFVAWYLFNPDLRCSIIWRIKFTTEPLAVIVNFFQEFVIEDRAKAPEDEMHKMLSYF